MLYSGVVLQSLLARRWRLVSGDFHGRERCLTIAHCFAHQVSVTAFKFTCRNPLRMAHPHNSNWLDKDDWLSVASFYITRQDLKFKSWFSKWNSIILQCIWCHLYLSAYMSIWHKLKNLNLLQFDPTKVKNLTSFVLWCYSITNTECLLIVIFSVLHVQDKYHEEVNTLSVISLMNYLKILK